MKTRSAVAPGLVTAVVATVAALVLGHLSFDLASAAISVKNVGVTDYPASTTMKLCIDVGAADTVKDFHVPKGSLSNGEVGVTVTDDQNANYAVTVSGGNINVFGGVQLTQNALTCFEIVLPAGHRWSGTKTGTIVVTSDGDETSGTGVVGTFSSHVFVPVSASVGGVLEDPDVETLPSEATGDSGGLSAGVYAAIAGAAAAALATATGGFALWRRRIR